MKKYHLQSILFICSLALIGMTCIPQEPVVRIGETPPPEEKNNSESITEEIENFYPGIDVSGREIALEQLHTMSDREIKRLEDSVIPVLRTADLRIIPYPRQQGEMLEPHDTAQGYYCANAYLTGTFLPLKGDWQTSKRDDCSPSGTEDRIAVSGDELLDWITNYKKGPTAMEGSILDQLE